MTIKGFPVASSHAAHLLRHAHNEPEFCGKVRHKSIAMQQASVAIHDGAHPDVAPTRPWTPTM
jgi:hypothetical protein